MEEVKLTLTPTDPFLPSKTITTTDPMATLKNYQSVYKLTATSDWYDDATIESVEIGKTEHHENLKLQYKEWAENVYDPLFILEITDGEPEKILKG